MRGMRDITREPMRPSGELENESEMTLELFGPFVKQSAVTSHSPTPRLDGNITQADASSSKNLAAPPSKRRRFNSEWAEGGAIASTQAQEPVCEGMCINNA